MHSLSKNSEFYYEQWLSWNKNEQDKLELEELRKSGDFVALEKCVLPEHRIQFGTAGLRAAMGAGCSRMNDLVVLQTTQGVASYILSGNSEAKNQGIVVGFDGRHRSLRFAEIVVNVFLRSGFKCFLFSTVTPTPYVSFGVVLLKAAAGVMITASHNPKQDNGYKLYWNSGCQIKPPYDSGISEEINKNLQPWDNSWDPLQRDSHLLFDPLIEVEKTYKTYIHSLQVYPDICLRCPVTFTYTAMHGVGLHAIQAAWQTFGFPQLVPVPEQVYPDPDFPTVVFPNPEEGKGALSLAMRTADSHGSDVILANDPDADRLAIAEKTGSDWRIFSGVEIGILFAHYLWSTYKKKKLDEKEDLDAGNVWMVASTVSCLGIKMIAQAEGFNVTETLTGFKWISNRIIDIQNSGGHVLFGFEEALGFMVGMGVMDKDGISAAVKAAEMVAYLRLEHGRTLSEQLEWIGNRYGAYASLNSYFICRDPFLVEAIFSRIRTSFDDSYPTNLGPFQVEHVRDLTVGYDSSTEDKLPTLPVSRSSQMITFTFTCGARLTLRTSGTEPKLKFYSEMCAHPQGSKEEAEINLQRLVENVVELVEARKHGLEMPQ